MSSHSAIRAIAVAAPLLIFSQPALAGESSSDMLVSATVLNNCTVVATPMVFGGITDFNASDVDSTSTLALLCTPNAAYEVQLNDGVNDDSGQRRLSNLAGDEFINYDIYSDTGRSSRWGDELTVDTVSGTASAVGSATLTAYGRINQGETSVSAGVYTDQVTVTVNF